MLSCVIVFNHWFIDNVHFDPSAILLQWHVLDWNAIKIAIYISNKHSFLHAHVKKIHLTEAKVLEEKKNNPLIKKSILHLLVINPRWKSISYYRSASIFDEDVFVFLLYKDRKTSLCETMDDRSNDCWKRNLLDVVYWRKKFWFLCILSFNNRSLFLWCFFFDMTD